jgi:hypothetical protein
MRIAKKGPIALLALFNDQPVTFRCEALAPVTYAQVFSERFFNCERVLQKNQMRDSSKEAPPLSNERQRLFEKLLRDSRIGLPPRPVIRPKDGSRQSPLTAGQERLWRAWRLAPDSEPFNEVVLLRLTGLLNLIALTEALGGVIRRHEILRTRFIEVDGAPGQYPSAEANVDLSVTDLTLVAAQHREAIGQRHCREQMSRPFDLEQLPLVRANVMVLSPSERLLLVALPRIVCDRWSRTILVEEICHLYDSFIGGRPGALDEPEIQWGDYTLWQQDRLQIGEFDREKEYWKRKLRNWPPAAISPNPAGPVRGAQRRASCKVRLSAQASRQVGHIAQSHKVTDYMILLAGWHVLLSQYSGQDEVCVQTVVANRNRAELWKLIGPVANRLVIKLDLRGDPSFKELMARAKETVIEALEHQQLPWELMAAELARVKDTGRTPLADAMFVMDEGRRQESVSGGLTVVEEKLEGIMTDADLAIVLWRAGESFEGEIEYSPALFDDETVRRMAAGYQAIMEAVLSNVACRIKDLPPLAD